MPKTIFYSLAALVCKIKFISLHHCFISSQYNYYYFLLLLLLLLFFIISINILALKEPLFIMHFTWKVMIINNYYWIFFSSQVAVASTHFPVCWGASTRETVKRYSIKILTLCTMESKQAREAVIKEKGTCISTSRFLRSLHNSWKTLKPVVAISTSQTTPL